MLGLMRSLAGLNLNCVSQTNQLRNKFNKNSNSSEINAIFFQNIFAQCLKTDFKFINKTTIYW